MFENFKSESKTWIQQEWVCIAKLCLIVINAFQTLSISILFRDKTWSEHSSNLYFVNVVLEMSPVIIDDCKHSLNIPPWNVESRSGAWNFNSILIW